MAKVTIIQCDNCGTRIEGQPNQVTVTRKGSSMVIFGDLCGECAGTLFGSYQTRPKPGRKPREKEIVGADHNGV